MKLTNEEQAALRALTQNEQCALVNAPTAGDQVNAAAAVSLARRGFAERVGRAARITPTGLALVAELGIAKRVPSAAVPPSPSVQRPQPAGKRGGR